MRTARTRRTIGATTLGTALLATALVATACGDDDTTRADRDLGASTPAGDALPQGDDPIELDPADFTADITNPWLAMEPGTRWTYEEVDEDGEVLEVVVIVTDETKKIANGVTARVVRDTVTQDGELVEDTFDWFAQDADANVWYLGEETAEFEDGEIATREGSFEAGVDGAMAGIIMPGDPRPGMKYRQEYYEGEAEDNGEILSLDELIETPYGQWDGALLTKDTITIEPDVQEYKLYVRDVGLVMAIGVSGGFGTEMLVAVDEVPPGTGTEPLGEFTP